MLNNKTQLYSNWIKKLLTNPKKTKGKLASGNGGRCCLGVLCDVAGLEKKVTVYGINYYFSSSDFHDSKLPEGLAAALNITVLGHFTDNGMIYAASFFKRKKVKYDEENSLANVNDGIKISHRDLGKLIKYLVGIEKNKKIEMFKKFEN